MKQTIILGLMLLVFGWLANDVYSTAYEHQSVFTSQELVSPSDRIKDSQISVYEDRIVIRLVGANWAKYTDTNSMDPLLDYGATGIEIRPESEEDIQVGDVVTYNASWTDNLVAHRVIETGYDSEGWYANTKGDNVSFADPGKTRFEDIEWVLAGVLY